MKDLIAQLKLEITKENCGNSRCFNGFLIILFIFLVILTILFSIFYYFSLAATILLTFYVLLSEWLSLLTKSTAHMVISIFVNFSNFGIIFTLCLLVVYVITDYLPIILLGIKGVFKILRLQNLDQDENLQMNKKKNKRNVYLLMILSYLLVFGLITAFIYCFIRQYGLLIMSIILEVTFLILVFLGKPIITIIKKFFYIKRKDQVENSPFSSSSSTTTTTSLDSSFSDGNSDSKSATDTENESSKEAKDNFTYLMINDSMLYVSSLAGMFDSRYFYIRSFLLHQKIYKSIITIIIVILQLYSVLYPYITGTINFGQFLLTLLLRACFVYKSCAYNLIDFIFNHKRLLKTLKLKKAIVTFWVVFVLHFILFLGFIALLIISKLTVFPTVKSARFIENNQRWYKLGNGKTVTPEGFCFIKAQRDSSLETEDFAMLSTLPRLYDSTENGRCFIKPSMRGLFNSTMKYIFGKNYEEDGIRIMCKKTMHYPLLVITSEKILNNSLNFYSVNHSIHFIENQFQINNTNFFESLNKNDLNEEALKLLKIYEDCVQVNGISECENEWDSFTQYYWPNFHSNKYEKIPGFERYQINIEKGMTIQPSFINDDGELMSGTHYIVGGSYEDQWGIGFFIETIGRTLIPDILDNFLFMYSFVQDMARDIFLGIEWFNRQLFYYDLISVDEMKSISELYNQFNFSNQCLFVIGHSISGTAFKGASYSTDIRGIVFESTDGANNANLNLKNSLEFKKLKNSISQIFNIYSSDSFFAGNDDNCDLNGVLPKRYKFPSVYDTACLASMTCSDSMKYVPFCKQVLTPFKNPEKEFEISFDAFLDYYGY